MRVVAVTTTPSCRSYRHDRPASPPWEKSPLLRLPPPMSSSSSSANHSQGLDCSKPTFTRMPTRWRRRGFTHSPVATLTGLEPATFASTERRSNQLSYRAMVWRGEHPSVFSPPLGQLPLALFSQVTSPLPESVMVTHQCGQGMRVPSFFAILTGLEPATFASTERRSNQLNYRTVCATCTA